MSFFVILYCPIPAPSRPLQAIPCDSLCNHYLELARLKKLWDHPHWKKLLHYKKGLFGEKSEVDRGYFFLSPEGKKNRRSELEATIQAILSETSMYPILFPADSVDLHPLVKFRARLRFLKENLGLLESHLPPVDDNRFQKWKKALDPEGITMIFASSYLNNPASLMGHTLLRIDTRGKDSARTMLNYGINYAANTGRDGGVKFMWKGVMGNYSGAYSLLPYYVSLQKYSNIESRDIWEYELNLRPGEAVRVIEHLWELGGMYMDYFFFTENCSYNLLTLLEGALPRIRATEEIRGAVHPIETVKALMKKDGLIRKVTFRPSLLTGLDYRLSLMPRNEIRAVKAFCRKKGAAPGEIISRTSMDSASLTRALDASLDYLQYRKRRVKKGRNPWKKKHLSLMRTRSRIKRHPWKPTLPKPPEDYFPHKSHGPQRLRAGLGATAWSPALWLEYRFAYHDLNSTDVGFRKGSQIEAFKLRGRATFHRQTLQLDNFVLEEFRLAHVQSLTPGTPWRHPFSWRFDLLIDRPELAECKGCLSSVAEAGAGKSHELPGFDFLLVFYFLNMQLRAHPRFVYGANMGPKGLAGFKLSFHRNVSLLLQASWYYPVWKTLIEERKAGAELRWSLHSDMELRLNGNWKNGESACMSALDYYF